jgi:hypothetical protein
LRNAKRDASNGAVRGTQHAVSIGMKSAQIMMGGDSLPVAVVLFLLAPLLWGTSWFFVWCMYRLPEKNWRRFVIGIPLLIAIPGVLALQAHLLAVLKPKGFDRHYIDYVGVAEYFPTIALMLFVAIREDKAKKLREPPKNTSVTPSQSQEIHSPPASKRGKIVNMYITDTKGVLIAVLSPPIANKRYSPLYGMVVVLAGLVGIIVLQLRLVHASPAQQQSLGVPAFIRLLQAAVAIGVGYNISSIFTAKKTLTLSSSRLEIRYSLLGLTLHGRSFENQDIKGLRYAQWQTQSRQKFIEHGGVRFEAGPETYTFGSQLTALQAGELIARMTKMYSFPVAGEQV